MKTHVLTGSKSEIVEKVARIDGTIREVIVFVEELAPSVSALSEEEIFGDMERYMVSVGNVDDSREAIYAPMEGE